jgi:hypothetical protein
MNCGYGIEKRGDKFYVFYFDGCGNRYDIVHHFETWSDAKEWIIRNAT